MRWRLPHAILPTAIAWPAHAQQDGFDEAEDREDSEEGIELGVRVGYGIASGKNTQQSNLQDRLRGGVPIGFDLGYRLHPRWFVGGYGEYAVGFNSATVSPDCVNCTFTWLHLSLQVHYRVMRLERADVWVGVGTGHQWFNATLNAEVKLADQVDLSTRTQTFSGPEYFNLQFGGSWVPTPGLGFGPYSALSIGAFEEGTQRCITTDYCSSDGPEIDVGESEAHLWFSTGLRVVFLP